MHEKLYLAAVSKCYYGVAVIFTMKQYIHTSLYRNALRDTVAYCDYQESLILYPDHISHYTSQVNWIAIAGFGYRQQSVGCSHCCFAIMCTESFLQHWIETYNNSC